MSNTAKMIIDAALGVVFTLAALALLVATIVIWVSPVFDASFWEMIIIKMIPTCLFALAVVLAVIFIRRFYRLFQSK